MLQEHNRYSVRKTHVIFICFYVHVREYRIFANPCKLGKVPDLIKVRNTRLNMPISTKNIILKSPIGCNPLLYCDTADVLKLEIV